MVLNMKLNSHKRSSHKQHARVIRKLAAFVMGNVHVRPSMEAALRLVPAKRTDPIDACGTKPLRPQE
jgi:hypothetical protein